MSERRASRVTGVDRSSARNRSTRPDDGELRRRLRELAGERRRFGDRRLHVLLRREGVELNRKRVQRRLQEPLTGIAERLELGLVQHLVAQPAIEALSKGVLHRHPRLVRDDRRGQAAPPVDQVESSRDAQAADRGVRNQR